MQTGNGHCTARLLICYSGVSEHLDRDAFCMSVRLLTCRKIWTTITILQTSFILADEQIHIEAKSCAKTLMKSAQCRACIGLCLWISPGQIRSWSSKHRCKYQTHQAHTHQGLLWRTLMQKTVQTRMQLSLSWLGKSLAFWNMHRAWTRCRLYVCALPCLDIQIAPCMHASDCLWQNCICTPTASLQVELTICISCSMLASFWTFINHLSCCGLSTVLGAHNSYIMQPYTP